MRRLLSAALVLAGCLTVPPVGPGATRATDETPAPALLRARSGPGEIFPAGAVHAFAIVQGRQRLGTSWGRYDGPTADGHHRFSTRIELAIVGRAPARSVGELVLDGNGAVVSGFERSDAAELVFRRKGDTLEISDGTRTDAVAYAPEKDGTSVMAHSAIFHAELMFALHDITDAELGWRLVSLSGGPPIAWTGRVRDATADGQRIRIDTGLGELVTIENGRVTSISVADTELEIVAVEAPWPEFQIAGPRRLVYTPAPGAAFAIREVELPGKPDEPALAGEVLVPAGAGPRPGVVFLAATGQEDRHGFAGPPPVDLGSHEITDAFAQAGFVVLRYDERGRGRSEPGEYGFLAQLADGKRALATLLVQPEVDPDRVIVLGHGEGGLRALALANERRDDVAAVALLATPGRPYESVLRDQAEATLASLPPETRDAARREQRRMLDELVAGRAVPVELQPQARWLREIFAVRPAELVARLRVPLWIGQGDKDFEVDPKADADTLVKAAKKAKLAVELRRYPDLDHLFKVETGRSEPARYVVPRPVDPRFIDDLVAWAMRVTTRDRTRR